ncbi:hypothetical protein BDR06DRAFT_1060326, partial [Suillus hirtellus]
MSAVPLHFSISMEERYQSLLKPAVHAMAIDSLSNNAPSAYSDDPSPVFGFQCIPSPEQDVPIPFLPLQPSFDTRNCMHWAHLHDQIENWLISSVHTSSSQWTWGRDMFWLAFVASNPCFPSGTWHMWNLLRSYSCRIGSEGLRPQLVRCAPFPSTVPYFKVLTTT